MCLGVYGPGSPQRNVRPKAPPASGDSGAKLPRDPQRQRAHRDSACAAGVGEAGPTQGRGTATGTLVSAESPRQRSVLTPSAPPLRGGGLTPHEQVGTVTLQAGHRKSVEPPGALGAAGRCDRAGSRGRLRGEQGRGPRREQTRPHGETCGDRWGAGGGRGHSWQVTPLGAGQALDGKGQGRFSRGGLPAPGRPRRRRVSPPVW